MDKNVRLQLKVAQEEKDLWLEVLDKTVYHNLSQYIRAVMDHVSMAIKNSSNTEVLIINNVLKDGIISNYNPNIMYEKEGAEFDRTAFSPQGEFPIFVRKE